MNYDSDFVLIKSDGWSSASVFTNLPILPLSLDGYNASYPNETAQLSASDLDAIARSEAWLTTGFGYFLEEATKVSTSVL